MLAAMRRAVAVLRADALGIEEVGVALSRDMIDAETAAGWLDHIGALGIVQPAPGSITVEAVE